MNKRFSVIAALCFVLTLSLFAGKTDEKKLLSLVPPTADGVLSIDLSAWLSLPSVKKGLTGSPDVSILKKRTGLTPDDIRALVFWGQEESWALLVSTQKPFNPAAFFKAPEYLCKKSIVEGKTLYTVSSPKARPKKKRRRKRQDSFCVTVLSDNVTAFFQDPLQASACLKLMKGKKGYTFPAGINGSFKGIISKAHGFEKAVISCAMTGAAKDAFTGTLRLTLQSAQQAEEMRGQAMLMLNLLLLQSMKDDPELGADIMKQFKFDVQNSDIILTAELPAPLLERLSKYALKKKQKKAAKPKAIKSASGKSKPAVQKTSSAAK